MLGVKEGPIVLEGKEAQDFYKEYVCAYGEPNFSSFKK